MYLSVTTRSSHFGTVMSFRSLTSTFSMTQRRTLRIYTFRYHLGIKKSTIVQGKHYPDSPIQEIERHHLARSKRLESRSHRSPLVHSTISINVSNDPQEQFRFPILDPRFTIPSNTNTIDQIIIILSIPQSLNRG